MNSVCHFREIKIKIMNTINLKITIIIIIMLKQFLYVHFHTPTDLPFLLCKQHKMKRQVIEFIEASVVKDEPPPVVLESLHQQNLICFDEPHALKVTGLGEPLNEALSKNALMFRFTQAPYYLKVNQCLVEGDIGYVTFTQEEGKGISL